MRKHLFLQLLVFALVVACNVAARADDDVAPYDASSQTPAAAEGESGAISENAAPVAAVSGSGPLAEGLESENTYEMKASLGLGLEYNDNIHEQADNKVTDFITHVRPAFSFKRLGGRIQTDIDYRGDYLFYTKDKKTEEYRHYINAIATGELVENLFFISVKEDMQQVYRDVTRGTVEDDESLNDLINRNRFTVAPYFTLHPSERTNLSLGYEFMDRRYSKGLSGQSPDPISFNSDQYDFNYKKSQSHTLHFMVDHELTERARLFTGGNVTRWIDNNSENRTDQSFYRYVAYFGGAYAFTEDLTASVKVGPSISVPDEHSSETRPFAEANLTYTVGRSKFSAFYTTTYEDNADTGGSTQKNDYGIQWDKAFDRSRLSVALSYNEYENEIEEDSQRRGKGDTYKPAVRYTYDLSNRLSCFIGYYSTIYKDREQGDHRHYGSYGIKHELGENSTIGLSHQIRYTDARKGDSYYTNRVMLDLAYTF